MENSTFVLGFCKTVIKSLICTNYLDSADVYFTFVELKGRGDPGTTIALDARPVKITQPGFAVQT